MKLLYIDSGITGGNSVSRKLTAEVVNKFLAETPALEVTRYDLTAEPISHLSSAHFAAQGKKPGERSEWERQEVALSERVMKDFLEADIVVIGAPMYNFTIPSQLKAWIDRVAVAGKTFRYTAEGPVGLAGGKRVIVASTRGGFYGADTPLAGSDHQETYLRTVFNFFGIAEIEFIRAEGIATGPENRERALHQAESHIRSLSFPAPVQAAA